MEISYLNIITFLLTTFLYYFALKPSLPYTLYKNRDTYNTYITTSYIYLAIYVLLTILIQFMVNSYIITSNCGGTITENIGKAGMLTFLPWLFIFGVLVLILNIYPGFKSAFSDIIGYYYISNSANKVLTELLMNKEIVDNLILETPDKNKTLTSASDIINRICGNSCILINKLAPSNFAQYWDILKPLMKKKYQTASIETDNMQNELFQLVITKDNIGEGIWYIYTGLILTLIVQFKITNRGCSRKPKNMDKKFLEKEKKTKNELQKLT
jgi:hypothetical protein